MTDNEKEENRLASLYRYNILDTPAEEAFDRITNIAKTALKTPIALITMIDKDRQWFKSRQGVRMQETSRDISFCSHTIKGETPMMVPNLRKDDRFAKNPFVAGLPFLRFYCGIPLCTKDGYNIGSLCVLGYKPRKLDTTELAILTDLSRLAIDEIELRQIADVDYLTGIATRRIFFNEAKQEFDRAHGGNAPLSVLAFEVGQFKKIKQKYGDKAGDLVLQTAVDRLRPLMKPGYVFARLGGEQFAILLHDTPLMDAYVYADKIAGALNSMDIMVTDTTIRTSCNMGIASFTAGDDKFMAIYSRAEIAMHQARKDNQDHMATMETGKEAHAEYSFENAALVF